MASSRRLITSTTLSTSATSVTFSSIPSTYTDLVLKISARTDDASVSSALWITINSDTTTLYSDTTVVGTGSVAGSNRSSNVSPTAGDSANITGGGATANTFGSAKYYIPSYTASQSKAFSSFSASENNATAARIQAEAHLYRSNTAISTLLLAPNGGTNFVSGSSFYLYGLAN